MTKEGAKSGAAGAASLTDTEWNITHYGAGGRMSSAPGRAEPPAGPPDPSARVLELEKEKLELTQALRAASEEVEDAYNHIEHLDSVEARHATRNLISIGKLIDAALKGNAPRSAAAPTSLSNAAAATEEAK